MKSPAVIGILGGTFNPLHLGHLRMAEELADAIGLEQVRFMPAAHPPHRAEPEVSSAHRVAMVQLGIAGNPRFVLDTRELERSGHSYTIDSLISLRTELGEQVSLCWLLGSDAFLGLSSWHRWQELLEYCHLIVAYRPGPAEIHADLSPELRSLLGKRQTHDTARLHQKPAGHIYLQDITALDISATHIRATLEQGLSVRYLLPDNVLAYINQHKLYRDNA